MYMLLKKGKELQTDKVKAFLFLESTINERYCSNSFITTKPVRKCPELRLALMSC